MGRIIKELLLRRSYRIFSCTLRKKDCKVEDKHRGGFEPAYIRSAGGRVATLPPVRKTCFYLKRLTIAIAIDMKKYE